jgi:hypothetical protein
MASGLGADTIRLVDHQTGRTTLSVRLDRCRREPPSVLFIGVASPKSGDAFICGNSRGEHGAT